jgi:hypothetical protein
LASGGAIVMPEVYHSWRCTLGYWADIGAFSQV